MRSAIVIAAVLLPLPAHAQDCCNCAPTASDARCFMGVHGDPGMGRASRSSNGLR